MADGTESHSLDTADHVDSPEPSPARDDRALLALFIGPNAARYLELYDAQYRKGVKRKYFARARINSLAGLFPMPWFFYRKLYLEGVAVILIAGAIAYLFPEWSIKRVIGMFLAVMLSANTYYIHRALRKIAAIEKSGLSEQQRDRRIRESGGVSELGGYIGAVLYAGLVIFAYDTLETTRIRNLAARELPACDAAFIREAIAKAVPPGTRTVKYTYANFKEVGPRSSIERICNFTFSSGGLPITWRFAIQWRDARKTQPVIIIQGLQTRALTPQPVNDAFLFFVRSDVPPVRATIPLPQISPNARSRV